MLIQYVQQVHHVQILLTPIARFVFECPALITVNAHTKFLDRWTVCIHTCRIIIACHALLSKTPAKVFTLVANDSRSFGELSLFQDGDKILVFQVNTLVSQEGGNTLCNTVSQITMSTNLHNVMWQVFHSQVFKNSFNKSNLLSSICLFKASLNSLILSSWSLSWSFCYQYNERREKKKNLYSFPTL